MNREWIEELLNKTDLVNLISRYVRLTKKGGDFWGCCPFHHEKDPSFKIYTETNSYHCFGCKESGDAISFLSKIESIERIDAIKLLASEAGMQLPKYDKISSADNAQLILQKERMYSLLQAAARFYYDNLHSNQGEVYKRYLISRGIDEKLIKRFGIGASLDWKGVINHLLDLGYTEKEMKDAGIVEIGKDGVYDAFKGRVLFPIIDGFDKVVSFSGRSIESGTNFAKYKNGTQTLVFDKSKTLFGINLLKKRKRTAPIEHIILVEGHIDVVMMHGAGFDTTVASMGTALTHSHAKQLKNICNKVYISFDGDSAGNKATLKGLDILASVGVNIRVIVLPEGKDPDDVVRTMGVDFYKELMNQSQTLTAYKINSLAKQFDLGDADGKSKFGVGAVSVVKNLSSPIEREEYLKQISQLTGYSMSALKKQAEMTQEQQLVPTINVSKQTDEKEDESFYKAVVYLLAYSAAGKKIPLGFRTSEVFDGIYLQIYEHICQKGLSSLYSSFDEQYSQLIGEILNYNFADKTDDTEYIKYYNALLEQRIIKEKEELSEEYKKTKNIEILKRLKTLDERLKLTRFGGR